MANLNIIKRRHPAFEALYKHWEFLITTFEGGPEWMTEANLFKFYKEGEQEFKERLARAYRDNISRDVVEIWTSHLFKVPVTRDDGAPPAVQEFWKRASKGKDAVSIDDLMREVSDKTGAVSPCYLVVDMPAAPALAEGQVLTQAQANELRLAPYAYAVYPTQALDFGLDEDEEFTWFLLEENKRNDEDPWSSDGKVATRYRLWTRTSWHLLEEVKDPADGAYSDGFRVVEEGEHQLGRVPVIQVCHKKGKDRYRGISLIEEIAYKDRAICNDESRLDEILCHQTFSQLFLPDGGFIASTDKKAGDRRKKMVEMGVKSIVLFNDKAQHPPMFLSPDAAQATLLLSVIDRLRAQVFEDAMLDSEGGKRDATGAKTATEAAFDFEKLNAALADKAKALESAERQMCELVCLWTKTPFEKDSAEAWVQYPRKFQVKALVDELAEALQAKQLGDLGAKFWELYLGRLVRKMLPDISDEDLAIITKEIAESHQLGQMLTFGQMTEQAMRDAETRELGAGVAGGGGNGTAPDDDGEEG